MPSRGKNVPHKSFGMPVKGSDKTTVSNTSHAAGHPSSAFSGNAKQTNKQIKPKTYAQGPQKEM